MDLGRALTRQIKKGVPPKGKGGSKQLQTIKVRLREGKDLERNRNSLTEKKSSFVRHGGGNERLGTETEGE